MLPVSGSLLGGTRRKKVSGFICHMLLGFADECLLVKGMVAPEFGTEVEKGAW